MTSSYQSIVTSFSVLNAAFYFLGEAKAISEGPPYIEAESHRRYRYIQAVIFFSWSALEFSLKDAINAIRVWNIHPLNNLPRGRRGKLKAQIKYVLSETGRPTLDETRFHQNEKIRDALVHGHRGRPNATLAMAQEIFDFCYLTIQHFYPTQVHVKA